MAGKEPDDESTPAAGARPPGGSRARGGAGQSSGTPAGTPSPGSGPPPAAPPPGGGPLVPDLWSPLTTGEVATSAADLHPRRRAYVPAEQSDQARFTLVRRLLWLLALVLAAGAAMLATTRWTKLTAQDVSDFVTMVFGAVLALASAAVGFYFGSGYRRD